MVERYSHLSPDHLRAAMERLVVTPAVHSPRSGAAELERDSIAAKHFTLGWCAGVRLYEHGGLASTGKAVDLKSTGPRGPWGFESLALRHFSIIYANPPSES